MTNQKIYYLSDDLQKQLNLILDYPVTFVDAFSGVGKTSAIREYFNNPLSKVKNVYWCDCFYESSTIAWQDICDLFAVVDQDIAIQMKALHMPEKDTLTAFAKLIEKLQCHEETLLIIDNFHLAKCRVPSELMNVISTHLCAHLHIVFISQRLKEKETMHTYNANIHNINAFFFMFSKENIKSLLKLENIYVSDKEIQNLYDMSMGWISAIALQIEKYKQTGAFNFNEEDSLIQNLIWNQLSEDEKNILLALAILEDSSLHLIATMMHLDTIPKTIENFLQYNHLIHYNSEKNTYELVPILKQYLKKRFYEYSSKNFQHKILNRAASAYCDMKLYFLAAKYYVMAENYDAMLSIPFRVKGLWEHNRTSYLKFLSKVVNQCPKEILCKYPDTLLKFIYVICKEEQDELLYTLSMYMDLAIKENTASLNEQELLELTNEWILLKSLFAYTDIEKTYKARKKAFEGLATPSKFVAEEIPWTFGDTSILFGKWKEVNQLDQTMNYMDQNIPCYLRLMRGHGAGANTALRAEVSLMRGQDVEAEILCYKAIEEARAYNQTAIMICMELVLARIAILRGNTRLYLTSYHNIKSYLNENSEPYAKEMAESCLLVLAFILKDKDRIPIRFYTDEESAKSFLSKSYYHILKSEILLFSEQYTKVCGMARYVIESTTKPKYVLQVIYSYIFLAVSNQALGHIQEAKNALKQALLMALPDHIYLPFSTHYPELKPLFEDGESFLKDPIILNELDTLLSVCSRQVKGIYKIKKDALHTESLSSREKEIACLARDNLSNKEIADMLFISDKTVKTILNMVFKKLEIHKRSDLTNKIL